MRISQMAHASIAAVAAAAVIFGLRADALPALPRPLVLYLGHSPTDDDVGFQVYKSAFAESHADKFAEVKLDYLAVSDEPATGVPVLARALARQPRLVIAPSAGLMRIARRVAPATPTIFISFMDPVRSGFVQDRQRRSEPVTGIDLEDRLDGKRLEILHEAYPGVRRVAVVADTEWAGDTLAAERIASTARVLGLDVTTFIVDSEPALDELFARKDVAGFDAWYVPVSYLEQRSTPRIVAAMRRLGKPCIYGESRNSREGGLMSYAQDTIFTWRELADLTTRVLDGEPPDSIPIARARSFLLVVRVTPDTGVAPPAESVIRRADVILR